MGLGASTVSELKSPIPCAGPPVAEQELASFVGKSVMATGCVPAAWNPPMKPEIKRSESGEFWRRRKRPEMDSGLAASSRSWHVAYIS